MARNVAEKSKSFDGQRNSDSLELIIRHGKSQPRTQDVLSLIDRQNEKNPWERGWREATN